MNYYLKNIIKTKKSRAQYLSLKGFSMTEVLIAIGIVAILVALLSPVLESVLKSARAAKCVSNLRTIGGGVSLYMQENNGAFPRGGWGDSGALPLDPPGTDGVGWLTDIWEYVGRNRKLFICPEGKQLSPTGGSSWQRMPGATWSDPRYPMHYAYNAQLNTNRASFRSNPTFHVDRAASVKTLAGLPIVIDIVFQNNFYGGLSSVFNPTPPPTEGYAFAARHSGRGNILWGDGSVSSMTAAEWAAAPDDRIKTGSWRRWRFCNGDY